MFLFRQDLVQSWIAEKNNKKNIIKKCRILGDKMKGSIFYTNIIAATKNTRVSDQEI